MKENLLALFQLELIWIVKKQNKTKNKKQYNVDEKKFRQIKKKTATNSIHSFCF